MKKRMLGWILAIVLLLATTPTAGAADAVVWLDKGLDLEGAFSNDIARVTAGYDNNGQRKFGLINSDGRLILPVEYDNTGIMSFDFYSAIVDYYTDPSFFAYGLEPVSKNLNLDTRTASYGFIDKNGIFVIPLGTYEDADRFSEGRAAVCKGGKWGYINSGGELVVPLQYDSAEPFQNGFARVSIGDSSAGAPMQMGIIDTAGNLILPMVDIYAIGWNLRYVYGGGYHGFYEGLCYLERDRAYFDMYGNKVIDTADYDNANTGFRVACDFHSGLASILKDGKYGYIDRTGKVVIPLIYDAAEDFGPNGLAVVKLGEKYGIINTHGQVIVPIEYDSATSSWPNSEFIRAHTADTYYIFNPDGIIVFAEAKYSASITINGDIVTCIGLDDGTGNYSLYQCYNSTGLILPPSYRSITPFDDGKVIAINKNFERAVLRHDGSVVIPFGKYDDISPIRDGLAVVTKDELSGYVDGDGKIIIPLTYSYPGWFENGYARVTSDIQGDFRVGFIRNPLTPSPAQNAATAFARTQSVLVDGRAVEFQMYALKDAKGNETNYVKLRDVASVLNGTSARFNVGWNGNVNIETGEAYVSNGSEMSTPFSGDRSYQTATAATNVNGAAASLDAFVLTDGKGNGYTYYKLRDLGAALGFKVDWSVEKGVFIESK